MESHELRIGNKVKCKISNDHGVYTVLAIPGWETDSGEFMVTIDRCPKQTVPLEKLRPIKLNEGLLKEYGFSGEVWSKISIGLWPVGPDGYNNLVMGRTASADGLPYCPAIEQCSNEGFTIKQAAEIQKVDGIVDDDAFPLRAKKLVVLPPIKYLHQLQNLYFSLTLKELELVAVRN